jgi:hypothetical protein
MPRRVEMARMKVEVLAARAAKRTASVFIVLSRTGGHHLHQAGNKPLRIKPDALAI